MEKRKIQEFELCCIPWNAVMFSASVSWSNFFSSVATRVASRDFMASWECESWTTLQITVLSSSLAGIFFDAVEVFSPLAAMLTAATKADSSKGHSTMERILSTNIFTSFSTASESMQWLIRYDFMSPLCVCLQEGAVNGTRNFLLQTTSTNHTFPHCCLYNAWLPSMIFQIGLHYFTNLKWTKPRLMYMNIYTNFFCFSNLTKPQNHLRMILPWKITRKLNTTIWHITSPSKYITFRNKKTLVA